jgi:hypothetical protein
MRLYAQKCYRTSRQICAAFRKGKNFKTASGEMVNVEHFPPGTKLILVWSGDSDIQQVTKRGHGFVVKPKVTVHYTVQPGESGATSRTQSIC